VAAVASLYAEPARAKVLLALSDGRSLPASRLATEAGVSPQATSGHLHRLLEAGLVTVEPSGRHRYYRISGPDVTAVLEALARIAPARPVRSLREGNRASALRAARTCYDHLAGRLGVAVTEALLERNALITLDGEPDNRRREGDRLSAPLTRHPYELGPAADEVLGSIGIEVAALRRPGGRRPLLRACLDWTEQRHHVAGRLGAAVATAMFDQGWLIRRPHDRAVKLTEPGQDALRRRLGVVLS
jgi:DNA-binding transcriptional ArsR family regulator